MVHVFSALTGPHFILPVLLDMLPLYRNCSSGMPELMLEMVRLKPPWWRFVMAYFDYVSSMLGKTPCLTLKPPWWRFVIAYFDYVTSMLGKTPCLTLKGPRKSASENVVCLCRLLHLLADFSNLHFAYRQTVWTQIRLLLKEQSDLGPHCLQQWLLK